MPTSAWKRSEPAQTLTLDQQRAIEALIKEWDPRDKPVHCSNCAHCIVQPGGLVAICDKGNADGRPRSLFRLLARSHATPFRAASACPDFASMDDES